MQPNAQGWCDSYYGGWSVNVKPRRGVHTHMLDEHIRNTIGKEKEEFKTEMLKSFKTFMGSVKCIMKKDGDEIKQIKLLIGDLSKFMFKLIDMNQLKCPPVEKKKKPATKPKVTKKIEHDGYL